MYYFNLWWWNKNHMQVVLFELDKTGNKHSVHVLLEIVSVLILCGRQNATIKPRTDGENTNAFPDCRTQLDIVPQSSPGSTMHSSCYFQMMGKEMKHNILISWNHSIHHINYKWDQYIFLNEQIHQQWDSHTVESMGKQYQKISPPM